VCQVESREERRETGKERGTLKKEGKNGERSEEEKYT
jgi:hypothetical protein